MKGIIIWRRINTCHTRKLFSLTRQIKPVDEAALDKLWGQEHGYIQKCKKLQS